MQSNSNFFLIFLIYTSITLSFGDSSIFHILSNIWVLVKTFPLYFNNNSNNFISLGFSDIEDILEREILIFICLPNEFKNKINALCKRLGNDYVEILQNDISLFEEIIWKELKW